MKEAERKGESAIIISHLSPTSVEANPDFSLRYNMVVVRFAHVITAQIFGHSHHDMLSFFRDKQERIVSVATVAPSLSPYPLIQKGTSKS